MSSVSGKQSASFSEWILSAPPWHTGGLHWSERPPLSEVFYSKKNARFGVDVSKALTLAVEKNGYRLEEVRLLKELAEGSRRSRFSCGAIDELNAFALAAVLAHDFSDEEIDRRSFAVLLGGKSQAKSIAPYSLRVADAEEIIGALSTRGWKLCDVNFVSQFLRNDHVSYDEASRDRLGDFFAVMRCMWSIGVWLGETARTSRSEAVPKPNDMSNFGVIDLPGVDDDAAPAESDVEPLDTGSLEDVFQRSADDNAVAAMESAIAAAGIETIMQPDVAIKFK